MTARSAAPRPTAGAGEVGAERLRAGRRSLLAWYKRNARDLPWRRNKDPYRVWVSEVMLQQTRVETVEPYFERFVSAFPSVEALAAATEDAVLVHWSGLGYYQRARRLHRAAVDMVHSGGGFPRSSGELEALPGFGPYTAAAVASIAFSEVIPAVDGNVERVLSRWLAVSVSSPGGGALIRGAAQALLSRKEPGLSNQALMDIGATLCAPKDPRCGECPLATDCRARELGWQQRLPLPRKRMTPKRRRAIAAVIERGNAVFLCRRSEAADWMPGMWEVPWCVLADDAAERLAGVSLERAYGLRISLGPALGSTRHTITNNRFEVEVRAAALRGRPRLRAAKGATAGWFSGAEIAALPLTGLTKKILAETV